MGAGPKDISISLPVCLSGTAWDGQHSKTRLCQQRGQGLKQLPRDSGTQTEPAWSPLTFLSRPFKTLGAWTSFLNTWPIAPGQLYNSTLKLPGMLDFNYPPRTHPTHRSLCKIYPLARPLPKVQLQPGVDTAGEP